jgi:NADH-quinone oxidoreductase subunit C
VTAATTAYGVATVDVDRPEWPRAVTQARDEGFAFFDLLTAVDREGDGFDVVLRLWDPRRRTGLVLRTRCPRDDARVPTLLGVFAGAGWHERATAELFGIAFEGHATTPLLLPASFEGHPLRKEFVLAARVAKRWPGAKEPGESDADLATPSRRRPQPPGVPPGWGERS